MSKVKVIKVSGYFGQQKEIEFDEFKNLWVTHAKEFYRLINCLDDDHQEFMTRIIGEVSLICKQEFDRIWDIQNKPKLPPKETEA